MKRYDVICAGLMVMDVIVSGAHRDVFDQDTQYVESIQYATGGDALNVAINLAKLDAKVGVAGCVGNDAAGADIIKRLDAAGVGHELVITLDDAATATSVVLKERDGERHFLYSPGANGLFTASQLTDQVLSQARMLYIGSAMGLPGLERGGLMPLLRRAQALGLTTLMDACYPQDLSTLDHIISALPYVDVFIPSLSEAVILTGFDNPEQAARTLHDKGAKLSGVKLGKEGCLLYDGRQVLTVPAIPCKNPLDTTGAGDAFMSGFVRGLLLGKSTLRCARMGSAMGYSAIQALGATGHQCTLKEVMALSDEHDH